MSFSTVRKLHFYLALILALPLTLSSLTGALLVYGPELQRQLSPPQHATVEPRGEVLPADRIIAAINRQRPELTVWSLNLSDDATVPYRAWLAGGQGALAVDQYSGEILHQFDPNATFEGVVTALHRRWLTDGKLSKWVRHLVSLTALLLFIEVVLGVLLWWLPPRPLQRLALSRRFSLRYNVLRVHQFAGLVTGLLLLVIAFTGMSFYWVKPTQALLEGVTQQRVVKPAPPAFNDLKPLADLPAALVLAQQQIPEGRLLRVHPPERPGQPVLVVMNTDHQVQPSQLWIGDAPVRLLYLFDGREGNTLTWLWELRWDIHYGHFAGPWVKALWVLVALCPAAFVISGIWLYLQRWPAR